MSITFYDFKMAPSPRRTRIILAEKGVVHDVVQIDMMKKEQMGEAYRKVNPECTLPSLRLDDGTVLSQVAAINAWLEETYPEPPLFGTSALEKAEIAGWQSRIETELGTGVASALRNSNPAMKDRALPGPQNYAQIPELAERGLAQIETFIGKLERHLEGRDYVATHRFSVADITAVVFVEFAGVVGKKPGDNHPNITRWHTAMAQRPGFAL